MQTRLRSKISLLFMTFGLLLAIPAVALAAELLTAEVDGTVNKVTVQQGNSESFNIKLEASGAIDCTITSAAPSTAKVHTSYSITNAGAMSSSTFSAAKDFVSNGVQQGTSGNCGTTWTGAPTPYIVSASVTVGATTPPGLYNFTLSAPAGTTQVTNPSVSGGKLSDSTATTLTIDVVAAPQNRSPVVQTAAADANGDEGDTLATNGAFSDPDGDSLTITKLSGAGTVTQGANGAWSWSLPTNDNGSGTVTVKASDGSLTATDSFDWSAANVPPTITSISASAQNALTGKNVTFTGSATDPSSADTQAGFDWQWSKDGGAYAAGDNPFITSFSTCGSSHTVSAKAADKDGGVSAPKALSNPITVYNASFLPPVDIAPYVNTVQKGRVIPVKISVSCNSNVTGLTPSIQLLSGDQSTGNETQADEIETYSVSSADTTGVMRAIDGGYIYNLQVPNVANTTYTIRVNPFGGSSASSNIYAVLKTR
jgi:hypothetical protein